MFKFMKSKSGFTLVELFIVLLIMGIVAAVALPIYTSLTKASGQMGCGDFQAMIKNTIINNYADKTTFKTDETTNVKSEVSLVRPGTITIKTGPSGFFLDCDMGTTEIPEDEFINYFVNDEVPCCPTPNNYIEVVIANPAGKPTTITVTTTCYNSYKEETGHKINEKLDLFKD